MNNNRTDFFGEPLKKKARVLLRPNGYVHIAFDTSTSILATGRAVLELFSDPIGFIESGCTKYQETTSEICRVRQKHIPLDEIPALGLAYICGDRQIVCEFSELFTALTSEIGTKKLDEPLNMKELFSGPAGQQLSDEKALLLRYYLEVGNFLAEMEPPQVERHIKLRDEVQLAVMKVAMTAFTTPKEKSNAKRIVLADCLEAAELPASNVTQETEPEQIDVAECSKRTGYSTQQVRNKIAAGEIKGTKDAHGKFIVEATDLPVKPAKRKKKDKESGMSGSYDETQALIQENNYFTPAVAHFVMNQVEIDYFAEVHREIKLDGRPALIIDIHPEFVTIDGRTNRQRILEGDSPICPDSPTGEPFHLHHMSRRMDGPLAIISTEDHRKYSKYFHQAPKDPNMDRTTFDMQRVSFFMSYLELYDVGGYDAIPYLNNPKTTEANPTKKSKKKKKTEGTV